MNTRFVASLAGLLLAGAIPVFAHHSFAAEYDSTQPVKVTGVVTKVEWTNPHIWFYLEVKDDKGTVTNWGFSGGPPPKELSSTRRCNARALGASPGATL